MRILLLLAGLAMVSAKAGEDMPDTALKHSPCYISRVNLIGAKELQALAGTAKVECRGGAVWTEADIVFPKVTVRFTRMAEAERPDHLNGFQGYLWKCAGEKMDSGVYSILQRIRRTRHVIGVVAEPAFDKDSLAFIQALARREQALVFLNSAVCNPEFKVLLGPENKRDKDAKLPVFESAQKRKDRSDACLKKLGVPVLPSLPPVIGDEELSPRTAKEAARRCVALAVVAAHAEGLEPGQAAGMLKKWSLEDALSPKEKDFLAKQAATKQERIQFTWRYECVYVLLWALKQNRDLGTPGKPNDAAEIVKKALALTEAGAMDKLELRSAAELLDATDFVYRCHWATTDARVKKKDPPKALDPGVVLEWHHVLNWLIRHEDAEWDNVNTDT